MGGASVARGWQDFELTDIHDAVTASITYVRIKATAGFGAWLEATTTSGIRVLRSFARGLQANYAAVKSGLKLLWSNAHCEAQGKRLKFLN